MEELLRIQLRGPSSSRPVPLLVDVSRRLSSLLPMFVKKLGLTPAPGDPPLDVHHAEGRSILNPDLALREAGVRENHVLVVLPRQAPPPTPASSPIEALENAVKEVEEGRRSPFELDALLPAAMEAATTANLKIDLLGTISNTDRSGAIPWVVLQLRDDNGKVRERAVQTLTRFHADDRVEDLRPLLGDPWGRVRGAAAKSVARFGWEGSLSVLMALLEDPDPDARAGAASALASIPVKGRETCLLALLNDPDPSVRSAAVGSLAKLGSESLKARLGPLLHDQAAGVRAAACRAAGELGARETIPALRSLVEKDSGNAIPALVDLDAREASEDIRARLQAEHSWDRREALMALTSLGTVELRDIASSASSKDALLRSAAVEAYFKLKASRELVPLLEDPDSYVRVLACEAVGGPPEIRRLRTLLSDRSARIRATAVHGLGLHVVREAAPDITPLLLDTDADVRFQAVQALERMDFLPAARSIAALMADEEVAVRVGASIALRRLGEPAVCADLVPMLSHPHSRVRLGAIRVLQEFDAREAIPAIVPLLGDPRPLVRGFAADRLARLGAESEAPRIRALLHDSEANVRWSAAAALASFGDATSVRAALDPRRDPETLTVVLLNGARDPILWKRLRDTRLSADLAGTPVERLRTLSERAGVLVDISPGVRSTPDPEDAPMRARGRTTMLTALIEAAIGHEVILDPGRIRIVEGRAAAADWMAWLSPASSPPSGRSTSP